MIMNSAIENFLKEKKSEKLNRKKHAILRAIKYDDNTEQYSSFIKTDRENYYGYDFIEDPTEEEINALYDYFFPIKIENKSYNVKNGWITFIGVVLLIELIIGIIWAFCSML